MSNNRLYPFWHHLEEGLKTGLPQSETKNGDQSVILFRLSPKDYGEPIWNTLNAITINDEGCD